MMDIYGDLERTIQYSTCHSETAKKAVIENVRERERARQLFRKGNNYTIKKPLSRIYDDMIDVVFCCKQILDEPKADKNMLTVRLLYVHVLEYLPHLRERLDDSNP